MQDLASPTLASRRGILYIYIYIYIYLGSTILDTRMFTVSSDTQQYTAKVSFISLRDIRKAYHVCMVTVMVYVAVTGRKRTLVYRWE